MYAPFDYTVIYKPLLVVFILQYMIKLVNILWYKRCDIIKPDTAKTICTYGSEYYKGESAVTVNKYGKGRVYYVGCDLDNDAMKELVRIIAKSANVETVDTPNGVEVVKQDDCIIILNHNENEVDTNIKGVSLFDGSEFDGVLDGYGVQFLEGSI